MMETTSPETKPSQEAWEAVAEKIYGKRMDGQIENVAHVHSVFEEEKYYQREEELVGQANPLLAMILWNIFVQSFVV